MAHDLTARIAAGVLLRDRQNMAPAVAYFEALAVEYPTDAMVAYELGGAYDTAGDELEALPHYERALSAGLPPDVRRRCLLQYGSTLRNLDRFDESMAAIRTAASEFPESKAIPLFVALTLHAAGRSDAALAALIRAVVDGSDDPDVQRYSAGMRGNADWLDEQDAATRH